MENHGKEAIAQPKGGDYAQMVRALDHAQQVKLTSLRY